MGRTLIIHASELVTCAGEGPKRGADMKEIGLIRDGAVLTEDGVISRVGTTDELMAGCGDDEHLTILDASGKTVLPGFVDSHTHFIFGGYRADEFGWRLKGDSYMSIMERGGGINATVSRTREASLEELENSGLDRLQTMLEFGVTTVEGKSGYGLDASTEIRQLEAMKELEKKQPVEIVRTFLGPHSVLPEYKGKERSFLDRMLREVMPEVKARGLAEVAAHRERISSSDGCASPLSSLEMCEPEYPILVPSSACVRPRWVRTLPIRLPMVMFAFPPLHFCFSYAKIEIITPLFHFFDSSRQALPFAPGRYLSGFRKAGGLAYELLFPKAASAKAFPTDPGSTAGPADFPGGSRLPGGALLYAIRPN